MNPPSSTDTSLSSNQPSAETISRRAYELWEQEGRPEGSDLRHWLQAEQELSGRTAANPSATNAPMSDVRPLQGTRAGAAANRDNKRASRSPFTPEKPAANPSAAKPELAGAGRRRS